MAYIKFCVLAVETSLKDQSVFITFNKEVDSDTISLQNIILAINNVQSSALAAFDIILSKDLKTLQLRFIETPIVNIPYILVLQENIKDLEGNNLDKSLFRNIIFQSSVTSEVVLNSPANFEIISEQKFSWTEIGDNPVNSFRLQISTDTGFHNLEADIAVKDKNEISLGLTVGAGQYYCRIRAEQDDMFGVWSETSTFLIQQNDEFKEENIQDSETTATQSDEIVIEDLAHDIRDNRLTMIEGPKNGVTPSSFSFAFSEDINPDIIKISVIRSDF